MGCPKESFNMRVLYFTAAWCGPCAMFRPIVSKVMGQGYPITKVDVDADQSLTNKYGVRSVPTLVKVDAAGNEIARKTGVMSEPELISFCS